MNFFRTITFRVTLWYLAILTVLLTSLGYGVHASLSRVLFSNFDAALKERAAHLAGFRDILSIIEGGTFEDQAGEYLTFYYYSSGRLSTIAPRGRVFPVQKDRIDRALAGETRLSTLESPNGGMYRVLITPFKPDNPVIRPLRFSEERPGGERRPEQGPDGGGRNPRPPGDNPGPEWRDLNERGPMPEDGPQRREMDGRPERGDGENRPPRPGARSEKPDRKRGRPIIIESAALVIARPTGGIDEALRQLLRILCVAIPLTLVFSAGGGMFLAHRALEPVTHIAETARRIEEKDLSRRIRVRSKDELGYLAETLNQMIDRLENAFKRQKEFTSDASHELRGPLAVIQAEATLSLRKPREAGEYKKTIEVIAGEAEHMSALTEQLLELARADSGREAYHFETLDMNDFVQDICGDMSVLCREKGLELKVELSKRPVAARGDRKTLRRLIFNIVNNAITYTDPGGTVTVSTGTSKSMAVISVADTGAGIPQTCLPHIFKRFYRVDKARSRQGGGSGLGLALCKHIIDVHQGRIKVESRVGQGSRFTIMIPAVLDPLCL